MPTRDSDKKNANKIEKLVQAWIRHRILRVITYAVTLFIAIWASLKVALARVETEISALSAKIDSVAAEQSSHGGPYPVAGGWIAQFFINSENVVETASSEQLSILSDSAHMGSSTLWYTLRPRAGGRGDGEAFLRISFVLNSNAGTPYAGIYAVFSNPPKSFDVSRFSAVQVNWRASSTNDTRNLKVAFQLCELEVSGNGNYAWKEVRVPFDSIRANETFVTSTFPFVQFRPPPWKGGDERLNPKHIIRFIIVISGEPGENASGVIDIDDIRFIE